MQGHVGRQTAPAAEGGRLLDLGTQLPARGHWLAKAWPQAGEATIAYVPTGAGVGESFWSRLDEVERQARRRGHHRAYEGGVPGPSDRRKSPVQAVEIDEE